MSNKIKIFTDTAPLVDGKLKNLSPVLSCLWPAKNGEDMPARSPLSPVTITEEPEDADFFALPMHWSYYLWNGKANMHEAMSFATKAGKLGKKVIVWHKGDLVPVVPFENAIVFAPGFLRSEMRVNYRGCPVFVADPKPGPVRHKTIRPKVGFCGFGSVSMLKTLYGIVRSAPLVMSSRLGRYDFTGLKFLPVTTIRSRALKLLSNSAGIDTNFIIRGYDTDISNSTNDFFTNIYENDYTLCVRGYGNWSYRFYQTLASGRIPIFVDTDCVLPLSTRIDWKNYCVLIDHSEMKYIGEKVSDFHASMNDREFIELQSACRNLWETHFTKEVFIFDLKDYLFDVPESNH